MFLEYVSVVAVFQNLFTLGDELKELKTSGFVSNVFISI